MIDAVPSLLPPSRSATAIAIVVVRARISLGNVCARAPARLSHDRHILTRIYARQEPEVAGIAE